MRKRALYYKQRVAFALSFETAYMNLVAIRDLRTSYIKQIVRVRIQINWKLDGLITFIIVSQL